MRPLIGQEVSRGLDIGLLLASHMIWLMADGACKETMDHTDIDHTVCAAKMQRHLPPPGPTPRLV